MGDPTSFSDFVFNYLINPIYWETQTEEFAKRMIPIMAFKIGRRQFGILGGIGIFLGATMFKEPIVEGTIGILFDAVDWTKNEISTLVGGFL